MVDQLGSKVNTTGEPSGSVCFSMMIWPRLVLVQVHFTFSWDATLKVALRDPRSTELLVVGSTHTRVVRSHPAFSASWKV